MLTFSEAAKLLLYGCQGMTPEVADKIMDDCKMSINQEDSFGFMDDAERSGRNHMNAMGISCYKTFSDFHDPMMRLQLSMALTSGKKKRK